METPQITSLKRILSATVKKRASNLHLAVGKQPIVRIDDKLSPIDEEEIITADFLEQIVDGLLTKEQQALLAKEKEITFIYSLESQVRFKVNIFYQRKYLSVNWQLIPLKVKTLTELGLPAVVNNFVTLKEGLVILAGPFGSGRTTTAVSLLEEINKTRAEHIITVEKPIEFLFANKKSILDQREVGQDVNSFLDALENSQEEDVDVLFVEEIAGPEELALVLDIANAGTLVFILMNTDSVLQTLEKILLNFQSSERERIQNLLASVLEGILVQRLLPKIGGGMALAVEVLVGTLAVRSIIRDGKINQLKSILQTSREEGMISLDKSLAYLVRQGKIDSNEALAQASNKEDFKSFLNI